MFKLRQHLRACFSACGFSLLLGVLYCVWVHPVFAAAMVPFASGGNESAIVQAQLPNGIRLILIPNQLATLTSLSIVYRLPTAPPSVRQMRLAQVARAVLPRIGSPQLSAAARKRLLLTADTNVERVRAVIEAGHLVLTLSVPHDTVELASFIEADRMALAAESLSQAMIDQAEEGLATSQTSSEELFEAWLDDSLTTSSAVLRGEIPSVAASHVLSAELAQFMRQYLNASNATLVLEGPRPPKEMREAVLRTFARIERNRYRARSMVRPAHGSPSAITTSAGQRAAGWPDDSRHSFFLSWLSSECGIAEDCPLAGFAEWLSTRLAADASPWCARVWARQSTRSARFTIGCELNPGFDAERWTSHVSARLHQFYDVPAPAAELQIASDRLRVRALTALSLPEYKAIYVVQQVAREEIPHVDGLTTRLNESLPQIRVSLHDLLTAMRRDVQVWANGELRPIASDSSAAGGLAPPPQIGYRPPKKGDAFSVTFPQIRVEKLSANLTLRHLEQRGALVSRVVMQALLRDRDVEPATAMVALRALQLADGDQRTLAERLWTDHAVRTSWDITSNGLSIELTGVPQRMNTAVDAVCRALQRVSVSIDGLPSTEQAKLRSSAPVRQTLLDQLRFAVGSPFAARVDPRRLAGLQVRLDTIQAKQIQELWATYARHGEFAISVIGPESHQEAVRMAAAAVPAAWTHSTPRTRTRISAPRIWILDQSRSLLPARASENRVDIEVIWPSRDTGANLRNALLVASISKAAHALGNLNAARPHNPTTQFVLNHRSLAECEIETVAVDGIDANRLPTVLRELEGYFERLLERVDYPQLVRLGVHDLQRHQLGWFASPERTMGLLQDWSLNGNLVWYAIDNYANLGLVSREQLREWSRRLSLPRATIIARGQPTMIESSLREVNRGELVVVGQ